jgi:lambda family phage portal protein
MAESAKVRVPQFDRFLMQVAPGWARSRLHARIHAEMLARTYEAAATGRRTENWRRSTTDANAANRPAIVTLRGHARDLVRNNAWARRAQQVITNNTVGWGIHAKAAGEGGSNVDELWKRWAGATECDADGRLNFYGLQALAMKTVVESGEVLIRRRYRRTSDGLTVPLQLQVLEPDFIDINKDGIVNQENENPIIQGIEFDKLGRRVAYWLYGQHPGSNRIAITRGGAFVSNRVPADDIIHVYDLGRPGQVRGMTWFAPIIVALKDFDEYEDASLMQAKIAALFAAVITDLDGSAELGATGESSSNDPLVETLEPGMILRTPPGRDVKFGVPPVSSDNGFSQRTLRRVAAGFGITYEDLTTDYSQVNFSSARMARLAHWANVYSWQWNMLIPLLCDGAWRWAMEAAAVAGKLGSDDPPLAEWTPAPMPMIEPDKEGLAAARQVRAGMKTFSGMVRELGGDPEAHFKEYASDLKRLDALGITLDSDVRAVSQAGLTQERAGAAGGKGNASGSDGGSSSGDE